MPQRGLLAHSGRGRRSAARIPDQGLPRHLPEQVRITKNDLTLFSEVPLQAVIQAPLVETYPNAIVTVQDATGVTIRQFTITGPYVQSIPVRVRG